MTAKEHKQQSEKDAQSGEPAGQQPFDTAAIQAATLMGGMDLSVTLRDGATEAVKVRELSIGQLPKMLEATDDELKLVELYCDKPQGWADTLTRQSFVQVLEAGESLNATFFSQWLRRREARVERINPRFREFRDKLESQALASSGSAPKQPSSSV